MKKILAMVLALTMVLSLAACGGSTTETQSTTEAAPVQTTAAPAEIPEVTLTMWGSEEDQVLLRTMADAFIADNAGEAKITIELGAVSEADAKDQVLNDIEQGPDVFAFAHDQIASLVNAGALMAIPEEMGKSDIIALNVDSSVEAATVSGELYAFPMTADNGYFMYYDKSVFTEEDLASWDTMLAAAEKAGRKITMDLGNAWYTYGFFASEGLGLTVTMNEDGSNSCNWACDNGVAVCEAIMNIAKHPAFLNTSDTNFAGLVQDGTICAGINGAWNSAAVSEAWGENYGACKLPTITINGEQVQMGAFSGYKMVGVNAYSDQLIWSMKLANYITNEENQALRFQERKLGPSNIVVGESEEVKADPALTALAAQMPYCTAQNVGGNFWSPVQTLGGILAEGNPDGIDLLELLTDCVEGVEAPIA